jgi:hypothetical protein
MNYDVDVRNNRLKSVVRKERRIWLSGEEFNVVMERSVLVGLQTRIATMRPATLRAR